MFLLKRSQKGQAIVLIAAAIVGLLAITALAIDAGNGYADRRHAQMAADNAALAGALAKANPPQSVFDEAYQMTRSNGYSDDKVTLVDGGPFVDCKGNRLDPVNHANPDDAITQYFEVTVRSSVNTFFGPVIGINQLKNCVYAIAHTAPSKLTSLAMGQSIAAVDCHGRRTLDTTGSADVVLIGGGVFSNSDDPEALYIHDPSNLNTDNVAAVGGINAPGWTESPLQTGVAQWPCPLPDEMIPKYTCTYTYTNFPPTHTDAHVTVSGGMTTISPGTYCISGNFNNPNMTGDDVTFVMLNRGISWNGNSSVHLYATSNPSSPVHNILIFLPYSNSSTIRLNGTAHLDTRGTVFAPASLIDLSGDFGASTIKSQWIGASVSLEGNLKATIQYDDDTTYKYLVPPEIELTR